MKIIAPAVATVVAALWVGIASAVTISDPSDWTSGWAYSTVVVAGVGTAVFTVEPAGGNPGARLNSTTVTPTGADTAFNAAHFQAVTVPAPPSGTPFAMQIDVLSGAGAFGQGQAVQILVGQGGSLYQSQLGITGSGFGSFTTLTFNGSFTAGLFTKISGPGAATPSFDGVTATTFGFVTGNTQSATLTQYYDNWNVTYALPVQVSATPVPALSDGLLLLLAMLVALTAFAARRRRL
jgi:hypothetical protein